MNKKILLVGVMLVPTTSFSFAGGNFSCMEEETIYRNPQKDRANFSSRSSQSSFSSKSRKALIELHRAYAEFIESDPKKVTEEEAYTFIRRVDKILLQHEEHLEVAKWYWLNEKKFQNKPLFAGIIYIADKNDINSLQCLKMYNVSDQKIKEMDAIRADLVDEIENMSGARIDRLKD